jgi:hypothetical protein
MPAVLPIDLPAVLGVVFGCLIVLIPLAGITARFTIRPIVDAIARMREAQGTSRDVDLLEKRVALLEQQVQSMESSVDRLVEKQEFDRKLAVPPETTPAR